MSASTVKSRNLARWTSHVLTTASALILKTFCHSVVTAWPLTLVTLARPRYLAKSTVTLVRTQVFASTTKISPDFRARARIFSLVSPVKRRSLVRSANQLLARSSRTASTTRTRPWPNALTRTLAVTTRLLRRWRLLASTLASALTTPTTLIIRALALSSTPDHCARLTCLARWSLVRTALLAVTIALILKVEERATSVPAWLVSLESTVK